MPIIGAGAGLEVQADQLDRVARVPVMPCAGPGVGAEAEDPDHVARVVHGLARSAP